MNDLRAEAAPPSLGALRSQFTAAWQAALRGGPQPRIERFLDGLSAPDREALEADLRRIEQEYQEQLYRESGTQVLWRADVQPPVDHPPTPSPHAAPAPPAAETHSEAASEQTLPPETWLARVTPQVSPGDAEPLSAQTLPPESWLPKTGDGLPPTAPAPGSTRVPGDGVRVETVARAATPTQGPGGLGTTASHPSPAASTGAGMPKASPAGLGYEILGELGRGGMGVVYKARQRGLKRLVALKMVLAGSHAKTSELKRFRSEAEAVAQIRHPNIVQIYEVGEQQGLPYFSLEFVEGGCLSQKIAGTPQPALPAARLVQQLAEAMQCAHGHGILHRDLKPANVLLDTDGTPKITDFGLAKRIQEEDSGQTREGAILGTPSYMAPEQAEGKNKEVGPPADIYALGAILYELLSGRPPFKAASVLDTVMQVINEEPVPPSRLAPKVPRDLETICLKCLQKEVGKRYPSAGALAEDLRRFQEGEPIEARPTPLWERAYKWGRRRPAQVALIGSCLLAAVGMIGLIVWHSADLKIRLDEAIRENDAFRQSQRLAQLRTEGQQFLLAGQEASAAQNWPEAHLQLRRALDKVGDEAELAELRQKTSQLLAEVEEHLRTAEKAKTVQANYQRFLQRRDDALFHSLLFTGRDLATNLQETQAAAREALAVFGIGPDGAGQPAIDPLLAGRRDELVAQCYELLLVLADAVAHPLPEQPPEEQAQHARQALALLDRAAALHPDSQAYHRRRAQYLEVAGDKGEAKREAAGAAAVAAHGAADYFLLGQQAYGQGRWSQALAPLDQALRLQPDHFWAQYCLALCYLQSQRWAEAKAGLNACLSRRPNLVWAYLLRGYVNGQLRAFDAADADFQEAEKGNPDAAARYALHVYRGVVRFQQDQLAEAAGEFERAIGLRPDQSQAYVNLAKVYQRQGKLDEAAAQLDHALRLEPRQGALYRERALLHVKRGDRAAALADFDQAIALAPPDTAPAALAENHLERAFLLYRQEDYEAAETACATARKLQPALTVAWLLQGEILLKQSRYRDAIEALDRYFQQLGKERPAFEAYRDYGHAQLGLGRSAEAADAYTEALALQPQADLYAFRGWAHLQADAVKLALRDFESALKREPDNPEYYAFRGQARVKLGDHRTAVTDAEEALRRSPGRVQGAAAARLYLNVARIFTAAMGQLLSDARQSPYTAGELRRRYEERAVGLLRTAVESLPGTAERRRLWQTVIQADTVLGPVRRNPEYARLALLYGAPK